MTGQQLKNSILQLAVQGKLVPQDPNDEPASVLLERIRAEKEQLIKEKKIKPEKNPSFIFRGADNIPYEKVGDEVRSLVNEVPFEIPESWEWVRLKNIVSKEIKRGKSPNYASSGNVFVFAQKCNVKTGGINLELAKYLDAKSFEKYPCEEYLVNEDIIINSTGNGTLGRIGYFHDSDRINDYVIVPDSHVTVVRIVNALLRDYLYYTLKYYQPYLEELGEGSTNQTELKPAIIAELLIPIPPMGEQIRIINKLIEVLPLTDEYGEKAQVLEKYNAEFPESLKKSILQQAVQGRLVPQNPNDEPASVLLERIRTEKQRLVKEGKIKKDKTESVIFRRDNSHYEKLGENERCIDDEIPFEIPETWQWCRLSSVISLLSGQDFEPSGYNSAKNGIPYITGASNLDNGKIIINRWTVTPRNIAEKGQLLIVCKGAGVGKMAILQEEKAHIARQVMSVNAIKIKPIYLQLILQFNIPNIRKNMQGVIPGISRDDILNLLIPIPPISEQVRIIDRLDELLPMLKVL